MDRQLIGASVDGQLLQAASDDGGDDAFTELVRRYRPFVYQVCRRITGNPADADDATQQVLLLLSQKGGGLTDRDSITGWLYRTAWNVSQKGRRSTATRRRHESAVPVVDGSDRLEPDAVDHLHRVVGDLPAIYHEAIVLHYFAQQTVAEGSKFLGIPVGTFAARVSRGLDLIRRRMHDEGLILTAGGVVAALVAVSEPRAVVANTIGSVPYTGPTYTGSTYAKTLNAVRRVCRPPVIVTAALVAPSFGFMGRLVARNNPLFYTPFRGLLPLLGLWIDELFGAARIKPRFAATLGGLGLVGALTATSVAARAIPTIFEALNKDPVKVHGSDGEPDDSAEPGGKTPKPSVWKPTGDGSGSGSGSFAVGGSGTAVPEPAAVATALSAAVLLGGRSRRGAGIKR